MTIRPLLEATALYILTKMSLEEVSDACGVALTSVIHQANLMDWEGRRSAYKRSRPQLLEKKEREIIEQVKLLVGEFNDTPVFDEYLVELLQATGDLPEGSHRRINESSPIDQKINILQEFGMNLDQATQFIESLDTPAKLHIPTKSKVTSSDKADLVDLQWKLLCATNHKRVAETSQKVWDYINWMSSEAELCKAGHDEAITRQRAISHNVSGFTRLIALYLELSGLNGHINTQAAIAKLHSAGFTVIRSDQMVQFEEENEDLITIEDQA